MLSCKARQYNCEGQREQRQIRVKRKRIRYWKILVGMSRLLAFQLDEEVVVDATLWHHHHVYSNTDRYPIIAISCPAPLWGEPCLDPSCFRSTAVIAGHAGHAIVHGQILAHSGWYGFGVASETPAGLLWSHSCKFVASSFRLHQQGGSNFRPLTVRYEYEPPHDHRSLNQWCGMVRSCSGLGGWDLYIQRYFESSVSMGSLVKPGHQAQLRHQRWWC